MKKLIVLLILVTGIMLAGCGKGAKEKKGSLGDLKIELEKKKKERTTVETEIRQLEEKIGQLDPGSKVQAQKLVSADTIRLKDFSHFIELQGKVDANDIVYVTPRGMPAQVKALYVKKGDVVRKGQLLAKLDDAVMLQQVEAIKVQRDFAENIYKRQKSLWDQGIGTEVQVITAKNNVDALNKQIATLTESWKTSFVYAPISGVADEVNIKTGEIFSGGGGQHPQIKIVNTSSLKVVTAVPENYVAKVKKGDKVEVVIPELVRVFPSVISMVGVSIDPINRSFTAEARLPSDPLLKPNQTATMKILDHQVKNAVSIPVNVVQTDEKGKYVYVLERTGDKTVARKKTVLVGEAYEGLIEIKTGLSDGDVIITEGYQSVYDGQSVTTGK